MWTSATCCGFAEQSMKASCPRAAPIPPDARIPLWETPGRARLLAPPSPASVLPSAVTALGLAALPVPVEPPRSQSSWECRAKTRIRTRGIINFSNNQLNPNTGSIAVRGVFANPKPPNGVRLMSPGMFVRIRLPLGPPHPALLVIDRAIQSDQGQKYVYVVNAENKTEYRQVVTGAAPGRRSPRDQQRTESGRPGRRGRDPADSGRTCR